MIIVSKQEKIILFCLFLFSFVIRAAVFQFYLSQDNHFWQVDSTTYHLVAQGIAAGKGISLPGGAPNFYRLPGYPVFIGFFYKLFGVNPQHALWAQVVLASFIPLLIFFLACVLFDRRRWIAWAAGWLSAAHLGLVLYSGFFMSESLFIFLFLLFCIFFFKAIHLWFCKQKSTERILDCACETSNFMYLPESATASADYVQLYESLQRKKGDHCFVSEQDVTARNVFFAGIFLGLASLVRPVGHYLFALVCVLFLFSRLPWRLQLKNAGIFSFAWLVPVCFWLIRNYIFLGALFFHTLPGGHFLHFSASRVVMRVDNLSYVQARLRMNHEAQQHYKIEEQKRGHSLNEIERCNVMGSLARTYFMQYPWVTLKLWMTDIFRTAFSLYSAELLYLDAGRPDFDYFNQERTFLSLLKRYLIPSTDNRLLKGMVWCEISLFFLMLLGIALGFIQLMWRAMYARKKIILSDVCSVFRVLPFIGLCVFIGLAGGYARMRLPVEPLLILLSLWGWDL